MNRLKRHIIGYAALALAVLGLATTPLVTVSAAPSDQVTKGINAAGGGGEKLSLGERIGQVINVLLFIIGALAVIMIIIGGIRYTISNGDSSQITGAKNTILYAVIGLIVALLGYAIVNFVVKQFS